MPNGATSGASDSIQPSTPNLDAAYAVRNSPPVRPAVEEIVTTRPERWARITGRAARVTLIGPNRVVSICARNSSGRDLLEEPGVEVAGVVDQHVEAAEPVDRRLDGRLGIGGVGDVELHGQQVIVRSDRRPDPLGVASGGDHSVAGGQRGLGDVDTHATASAGNEPNLLVGHASALLLFICVVGLRLLGGAPSTEPAIAGSVGDPVGGGTDRDPQPRGTARRVEDMAGRNHTRDGSGDFRGDLRGQIREFLSTRRAKISPEQAGLPVYRRRSPTGLGAAPRGGRLPGGHLPASTRPGSSAATPPASPRASSRASRTHCSSTRPSERTCATCSAPPARPARRAGGRRDSGSGPRCSASWTR